MATTTTNFGWDIPQSTDLVKDGATAIAALGQDIDTALVDLKGGTTGQVLAKASGTDLDFSWVAQDDSNAIQNAIVDAKGDLIAATAADTPARLAVGTNGHVLTADSTAATGIKWAAPVSSSALTFISAVTFSASSSIDFSNVFSSTYDNYLVMGSYTASSTGGLNYRFRVSGADDSTANYNTQNLQVSGASVGAELLSNQTSGTFAAYNSTSRSSFSAEILSPFLSQTTSYFCQGQFSTSTLLGNCYYGAFNATTSFTGMTFLPAAGNVTGTIRIYGISNA
jgi:hypothetical protein